MTRYVEELRGMLPHVKAINQFDKKQMAKVTHSDNAVVLYSYRTRVGRKHGDTWYLTIEKYSRTTCKQLTQFACTVTKVEWVDDIDNIRN